MITILVEDRGVGMTTKKRKKKFNKIEISKTSKVETNLELTKEKNSPVKNLEKNDIRKYLQQVSKKPDKTRRIENFKKISEKKFGKNFAKKFETNLEETNFEINFETQQQQLIIRSKIIKNGEDYERPIIERKGALKTTKVVKRKCEEMEEENENGVRSPTGKKVRNEKRGEEKKREFENDLENEMEKKRAVTKKTEIGRTTTPYWVTSRLSSEIKSKLNYLKKKSTS